jgi:hypothetical protein
MDLPRLLDILWIFTWTLSIICYTMSILTTRMPSIVWAAMKDIMAYSSQRWYTCVEELLSLPGQPLALSLFVVGAWMWMWWDRARYAFWRDDWEPMTMEWLFADKHNSRRNESKSSKASSRRNLVRDRGLGSLHQNDINHIKSYP